MILPAGFALPPLPYLAGLAVGAAVAVGLLYWTRPPVTEGTVTALLPWMAAGGALYAAVQAGLVPAAVAPLFGSPAVYVTVGIAAAVVWSALAGRPGTGWRPGTAAGGLALAGAALAVVAVGAALWGGARRGDLLVGIPAGIVVVSVVVTALAWAGLRRVAEVSAAGTVGLAAVFGHALDGVSTAAGYELLGFGEQVPLSRFLIELGATLPTAAYIGDAWLFVVVKLALASLVVVLFEDYVREEPAEGYLLLGLMVAVGFGPGFHNLVLFAVA